MSPLLERRFALAANGTNVRTEALAGVTTFLTMAYIIFVQPAVLGAAGMDLGAVLVATCLSTAFATTLMVTAVLMARRVPGALLWGILASTAMGYRSESCGARVVAALPSIAPTFLQLDVLGAVAPGMITVVFVFFILALFDSVGTLVGVGAQAGFMRNGTLPRARQALLADTVGTS